MRKNCGSEGLFLFNGILVVRGCKIVIIIYFKGSFIQAVASDSLEQACKPQICASSKLFLLLSSLFKGFHSANNNISGHWPVCSMQRPPWRKEQSFYRSVGATSGPANMLTYLHIFQKNLKFFLLTVWLRLVWWTLPHAHISVKGPFTVCLFVLRLGGVFQDPWLCFPLCLCNFQRACLCCWDWVGRRKHSPKLIFGHGRWQ